MAKYGLFNAAGRVPMQEFEGDYMVHSGEYVTILKKARHGGETGPNCGGRPIG